MKLNDQADRDSLYIDLSERPSAETREVSEGVVLDYGTDGNLVGIDVEYARRKVALQRRALNRLPGVVETSAV